MILDSTGVVGFAYMRFFFTADYGVFQNKSVFHLRQRFFGQALRRVFTITDIFFIFSAKNRRVLLIFKVQV